jgi:two-component sensor histidine kinase
MEARRTTSEEARRVLEESMNRIHSISVVHEFMANQGEGKINLREVGQRLVAHMRQMANSPNHQISFTLSGPDIFVPSQQATSSALVINELLQNAAEHGLAGRDVGAVSLVLADLGDKVLIQVSDDGAGLPNDFDLHRDGSVGLNVVQVLVRDDLKGEVSLSSNAGVTATVTFPKPVER